MRYDAVGRNCYDAINFFIENLAWHNDEISCKFCHIITIISRFFP